MYMIVLISLFLLIFGSLSAYAYSDIKEETSEGLYAKNIFLSNLIVSFLFALLIFAGHYFKLIGETRLLLISLAILIVTSVLFVLTAYFLEEERTSPKNYDTIYNNLIDNTIRKNVNLITLSIVLASVGFGFFIVFTSFLMGRYSNIDDKNTGNMGNQKSSIIIKSNEKPKTVVIKKTKDVNVNNNNNNNNSDLYDDFQIRRIMIV